MVKALQFLDLRKKTRVFKIFLFLFFMIGFSYGFHGGYVTPLFLSTHDFDAEMIGLIIGLQILFASVSSYLFSKTTKLRQIILLQEILFSTVFSLLGFLSPIVAGVLLVFYGFIEGMSSIGQEGIFI
ncbi:MAG: hypothetical protein QME50_02440 [Candidatus Bathyarchaeota archaeon]|nr:hypothetical protein [Candidatus Bathyarchaeota archaeon]